MSNKLVSALESLLFVAGDEGLDIAQIAQSLGITEMVAYEVIDDYKKSLGKKDRGIRLAYLANNYKLTTKPENFEAIARLIQNPTRNRLSQAALETLAIIAYKQPVTRMEIEEIRAVSSDRMLRKLSSFALVKEVGRKDSPGKPVLYAVTDEFLNYFNLSTLDELPELSVFTEEDVETEAEDLFMTKYREEFNEEETNEESSLEEKQEEEIPHVV
jgi:segregation and condensation protein B